MTAGRVTPGAGARTRTADAVTFGPGSLESITLYRRVRRAGYVRRQVRVEGTTRVYCGAGGEHAVEVSGPWTDPVDLDGAVDEAALAAQLVEWRLESWVDPCERALDLG